MSPNDASSNATYNTILFAGLLAAGAIGGTMMAVRVIPDSHATALMGAIMLPLGVVIGLSFAVGKAPPSAVLNLFAVFAGRTPMATLIRSGGGSGGVGSVAIAMVIGSLLTSLAMAFAIDVFVKPAIAFTEIAQWFGGAGLVFGIVAGGFMLLVME